MNIRVALFSLLAMIGLGAPAHAAWHEASSDHFVVYSDSREDDIRQFAGMLERFHRAMELKTGRQVDIPSPSSRVTIFVVGSGGELRDVFGTQSTNVAGFYIPRASGSVAFTPRVRFWESESFEMQILLHEYAHHFLISTSPHAMPRWLSEGAAEFFGSVRFHRDGAVDIGMPNNHRAYELANAVEVPIRALLDHETYAERKSGRYDAFYGRAWLLFHYLAFSSEREGQLGRYWQAVAGGVPSLEAAEAVFGDLRQLDDELRDYNHRVRLPATRYTAREIGIGEVTVRRLSEGMDAMMPVIIRSRRGVDSETAPEVLSDARRIAAEFPGDPGVLAALAEAEFDTDNYAEAIAAADRAIALDPGTKNAYVQKGYALFALAEGADDSDAAYAAAMKPFLALNAIENDHPLPLIYLYRSELLRGRAPSETAQAALERASQLTPFDQSVTMDLGAMLAARGDVALAALVLGPVAADPHGGPRARHAHALIEALERAEDGEPFDVGLVLQPEEGENEGDEADKNLVPSGA